MWWAHEVAGWEAWCRVGLSGYIGRGVGWSGSGNYRVVYRLGSSGYLPSFASCKMKRRTSDGLHMVEGSLRVLLGMTSRILSIRHTKWGVKPVMV